MWRLVIVLLLVFAAGAQQLVAQTHWHSASVAAGTGSGSPDGGAGKHDDCLWCQIAAHASAAAPPELLQFLLAPDEFEVRVPADFQSVVIPLPAHAWQSRGPPTV